MVRHLRNFVIVFGLLCIAQTEVLGQCSSYRSRIVSSYIPSTYVTPSYVTPVVSYAAPIVNKEVIVEKVAVPVFNKYVAVIPIVEFPTYGAHYSGVYTPYAGPYNHQYNPNLPAPNTAANPGQQGQTPRTSTPTQSDDIRQILDFMKGLDARIRKLEEGGAPKYFPKKEDTSPKKEEGSIPSGAALGNVKEIYVAKCAVCHSRETAKEFGKDFVLIEKDGSLTKLTDSQIASMQDHVYAGTMPKINARSKEHKITPLTDAEAGVCMAELSRQRKLNSKTRLDTEISIPIVVATRSSSRVRVTKGE